MAHNGAFFLAGSGCNSGKRARAGQVANDLLAEFTALRVLASWNSDDQLAGDEVRKIQGAIANLRVETREGSGGDGIAWRLFDERAQQNVAKQIVKLANLPGVKPIADPGGNDPTRGPNGISRREVGCQRADDGMGSPLNSSGTGLCSNSAWNVNLLEAAMGSRGNDWARNRGNVPPKIDAIFQRVAANNSGANYSTTFTWGGHTGGGYYASLIHDTTATNEFAWGYDHGSV